MTEDERHAIFKAAIDLPDFWERIKPYCLPMDNVSALMWVQQGLAGNGPRYLYVVTTSAFPERQ